MLGGQPALFDSKSRTHTHTHTRVCVCVVFQFLIIVFIGTAWDYTLTDHCILWGTSFSLWDYSTSDCSLRDYSRIGYGLLGHGFQSRKNPVAITFLAAFLGTA